MKTTLFLLGLFMTHVFSQPAQANCVNFTGHWKGSCQYTIYTNTGKNSGTQPLEFTIAQKDCSTLLFLESAYASKIGVTVSGSEPYPPDYDFHWSSSADWGPGQQTFGWLSDEQFRKRDTGAVHSNQDNGVYSLVNGQLIIKETTNMVDWKDKKYQFSRAVYSCTLNRIPRDQTDGQIHPAKLAPMSGTPVPQSVRLLNKLKSMKQR